MDEGAIVALDGSGSSDPEGEDLTYLWTQVSNGAPSVSLSDATLQGPVFTSPDQLQADVSLEFTLIVTDARGLASTAATVAVTVTAGDNDEPTADAGADRTVGEGAIVALDGSGSSDPEGEDLSYLWTQVSNGAPSVSLSDATLQGPVFTSPDQLQADVTLAFTLIVTDARGLASTAATVAVTVTAGDNDEPTADAGADRTVDEGAIVALDGSGSSDPEGEDLSYLWTQLSNGAPSVSLSDATLQGPVFTSPDQLQADVSLEFTLIVTDARGLASTAATVAVTVTAGDNDEPTADAGADRTVDEGAIVALDGSGSSDPEGEDLSYLWTQVSNGAPSVTLSDATLQGPVFTSPDQLQADVSLEFTLIVTDARGLASTAATVAVTVTAGDNDEPTADAGADRTVGEGAIVALDGSGSSDPEGEDLSYLWTQVSNGAPSVSLSDATLQGPVFTSPDQLQADVTLAFTLIVTDARGLASTAATVAVTVTAGDNDEPTADAGTDSTVDEGAVVALDGSGSSDPEGEDLSYLWTQVSNGAPSVSLSDATLQGPGFTSPDQLQADVTLAFTLIVTDARGLASTAATVEVTVTAGDNDAPTADAGADSTVDEGAVVALDGSGSSDPEGEDLSYLWTQVSNGAPSVSLSDATLQGPVFTSPDQLQADVSLEFTLIVTDARGLASTAATVAVTVTAGDNDEPTADAGADRTVGEGAIVALDGSGSSDPEGEDLSYLWTQVSNGAPSVSLSDATLQGPVFTSPDQLQADVSLEFTLIVTDARGLASTAATVAVTVTAGDNDEPTADAGADRTVDEGAIVALDGSGSSDPEGEDLSYLWTQVSNGAPSVSLSDATLQGPVFTSPDQLQADVTLEFTLIVTDARGLASTAATVAVTVTAGDNDEPTADAGADRTVGEGAIVALDGSGSSDPEGEDLSYLWTQVSNGAPSVTLSDATLQGPGFTSPDQLQADVTLAFTLIVTDARGLASTAATVAVTVTAGDNDEPTADAGADRTVDEGAIVALDGSGSSDPEGEDLSYLWTQLSNGAPRVSLSDATLQGPGFTSPDQLQADVTLAFTLIVTDARGLASTAATVAVTVTAGDNDEPTADAGADRTVGEGAIVALDGSGSSDPEGEDLSYLWTQVSNGAPSVTLSDATLQGPVFTSPDQLQADVTLAFTLIVTDARGLASTAATVAVTVTAGDNDEPTADAGADRTVDEGAIVALDGNGSSDPEGEDLTYLWTQVSNGAPRVTLSDATLQGPGFTSPDQLQADVSLEFTLIVTDARGLASTAATVTVTVTAGTNDEPTADAGADRTVGEAVIVALDGSGSSDPEGEDLTYLWTQVSNGAPRVSLSDATLQGPVFTSPDQLQADVTLAFTLVVTDARGLDSTAATVTVTVTAGSNDAPTIIGEPATAAIEGVAYSYRPVVADADDDVASLTFRIEGKPVWAEFDNQTGELSGIPLQEHVGPHTGIVIRVEDPSGASSSVGPFTINVSPVNNAAVQERLEAINLLLTTRSNLLLSNHPRLTRRISRLQLGAGEEQLSFAAGEVSKLMPLEFNLLSLGSGTYSLYTSLDRVNRAAGHLRVAQGGSATHDRRRLDVWFEGSVHNFNGAAGFDGEFGIAHLGADYLFTPDLLLGGSVQYDDLSGSDGRAGGRSEGRGWLAGPVVTARLRESLYLDARLAWGLSDNNVSVSGASTDSFKSVRWLTDISLSGDHTLGGWTIQPSAGLSYMEDRQRAYLTSQGAMVPGQTVSQGELRLGPSLSTRLGLANGWLYEPSLKLDAIYSHVGNSGGAPLGGVPAPDGWRARLEAGLTLRPSRDASLSFTGNYDGIGQVDLESWGVGLGLQVRF